MHTPAIPSPIDPELLMLAYRGGVFPMSDSRDDPDVFWVEPKFRAILPLDGLHMSRSLAKTLRQERFAVTCNRAFAEVIRQCAAPRMAEGGQTWISHRICASYELLHRLGHAHSIECWHGERLVGGLYGVGFDRVFCGESMFARETDASKVALAWLVAALRRGGAVLLDCQFMTHHLASMGAIEISQQHYITMLRGAQFSSTGDSLAAAFASAFGAERAAALAAGLGGPPLPLPDAFAALLGEAATSSSPGNFIAQSLTHTS